jgi:hypothetical protein
MKSGEQPDLFGAAAPSAPPAYVVPYPIAVNTLTRTLEMLQAAERWPWDPDMKATRMERNVPRMLAVLPPDEAEVWRARIAAEAARLDAAA